MASNQKSSSAGATGSNTPKGPVTLAGTQPFTLETIAQLFGSLGEWREESEPLATGIDCAIALAEALKGFRCQSASRSMFGIP
jgi:hypothetical protein